MDKNEKSFGLKTGYSTKNRWKQELKDSRSSELNSKEKYPNGWVPTVFLAISTIVALGLALGLSPKTNNVSHALFLANSWYNTIWYVFGILICCVGLLAIGRTDFLILARYGLLKFSRVIKFDVLRRKMRPKVANFAIDEVSTVDDLKEYIKIRNKKTKKLFFINLGIYGGLFVIWTIVMSILNSVY